MTSLRRGPLLLVLLAFAMLWFGLLDYRRLHNPDEGRYAEIPREMVATGDWLTPRLNGIKYFDKPPLQYWATATAYTLFGERHWTTRLWSALTGFLGILVTALAAARLFNPHAGLIAGAVLAGSLLWNMMGHLNTLDMAVSFFLSAAVFALCLAQRDEASPLESRRWQDGAWALLALAVLSKGLIGLILPAITVIIYTLWQRDWGFVLRLRPFRGLAILLVITAPWFIAVSIANPEFAHFFFIHEHVERFLTKAHGRYQPMWYFIPVLLLGMIPWFGALFPALRGGFRSEIAKRFQPQRFLLAWALLVFVFFSVSSSKLASYILPIFPALAALIGLHLTHAHRSHSLALQALPAIVIGIASLFLVPYAVHFAKTPETAALYVDYQPWLYAAAILLAGGGGAAFVLARRGRSVLATLLLALGGHGFAQSILLGHDSFGSVNSPDRIAAQVRSQVSPDVPFFSVNTYVQSFQFYLKRTTTLVAYQDELAFGIRQEPQKFINDIAAFEQVWLRAPAAWALMPLDTFAQLKKKGLPMTEVARDPRRVIVRKDSPPPGPASGGDDCSAVKDAASVILNGSRLGRPCAGTKQ